MSPGRRGATPGEPTGHADCRKRRRCRRKARPAARVRGMRRPHRQQSVRESCAARGATQAPAQCLAWAGWVKWPARKGGGWWGAKRQLRRPDHPPAPSISRRLWRILGLCGTGVCRCLGWRWRGGCRRIACAGVWAVGIGRRWLVLWRAGDGCKKSPALAGRGLPIVLNSRRSSLARQMREAGDGSRCRDMVPSWARRRVSTQEVERRKKAPAGAGAEVGGTSNTAYAV